MRKRNEMRARGKALLCGLLAVVVAGGCLVPASALTVTTGGWSFTEEDYVYYAETYGGCVHYDAWASAKASEDVDAWADGAPTQDELAELEEEVEETLAEYEAIVGCEEYEEALEKASEGSVGYFEWAGCSYAVELIESFAEAYPDAIDIGGEGDSTSLANLIASISLLEEVNRLREEEGCDPEDGGELEELHVYLSAMADSEVGVDYQVYTDTLHAWPYDVSSRYWQAENAASGMDFCPVTVMYYAEKEVYDTYGYTGSLVEHYTNMCAEGWAAMSIACTGSNYDDLLYGDGWLVMDFYRLTSSSLAARGIDPVEMTVAELRESVEEYCDSIGYEWVERARLALDAYEDAYEAYQEAREAACEGEHVYDYLTCEFFLEYSDSYPDRYWVHCVMACEVCGSEVELSLSQAWVSMDATGTITITSYYKNDKHLVGTWTFDAGTVEIGVRYPSDEALAATEEEEAGEDEESCEELGHLYDYAAGTWVWVNGTEMAKYVLSCMRGEGAYVNDNDHNAVYDGEITCCRDGDYLVYTASVEIGGVTYSTTKAVLDEEEEADDGEEEPGDGEYEEGDSEEAQGDSDATEEDEDAVGLSFPDVQDSSKWYYESVYAVAGLGYMTGYDDGYFGVGDTMTRAQLAAIMWRIAEPEEAAAYEATGTANTTGMPDVKAGAWYTGAADWAVEAGVVNGKEASDGTRYFDPTGTVTFQEFCAVLANYLDNDQSERDAIEADEALSAFTDASSVSSWAAASVAWCVSSGLVNGNDDGTLAPKAKVKRERTATVVKNAIDEGLLVG